MKRMRRSSAALIVVGAAILALGTALALSAPKDFWREGPGRGARWGAPDRPAPRRGAYGFRGMRPGIGLGLGLAPIVCLVPAFLVGMGVGIVAGRRVEPVDGATPDGAKGGE